MCRPDAHLDGMDALVQDSFARLQAFIRHHQKVNRPCLYFHPLDYSFHPDLVYGENIGKEDGYKSGDEFDTNTPLDYHENEGYDEGKALDDSAVAQDFLSARLGYNHGQWLPIGSDPPS